jgi:hypothetical protein
VIRPDGENLQGYIAFPLRCMTLLTLLWVFGRLCVIFHVLFSRALVLLCLISIPGMFFYLVSCFFSVFMFKIVEL